MSGNLGTIYYEVDARTGKLLMAQEEANQAFDAIERGAKRADTHKTVGPNRIARHCSRRLRIQRCG
ncbi:TPA: hypothetical protein ACQ85I_001311 [Escherichia coli]|nr:hypothetical protein [Escherichia coli]ELK0680696.1 hypothetical protein [Escherichia coli]MDH7365307.1 hypothetical protein [Escherichia coli]HCT7818573.1 hypothetical protein [Escherichia coli]